VDSGVARFLADLREGRSPELRNAMLYPRLERAIGVIYRPETELASNYFDACLPRQFDAYLWFEETRAVTPLPTTPRAGVPETYPFGLWEFSKKNRARLNDRCRIVPQVPVDHRGKVPDRGGSNRILPD